jgi:hypothetical protein
VLATSWVEAVICWVDAAISSAIAAASLACCRIVPTRSRSLSSIALMERVSPSFSPRAPAHSGMPRSPWATRPATVSARPVGRNTRRINRCTIASSTAIAVSAKPRVPLSTSRSADAESMPIELMSAQSSAATIAVSSATVTNPATCRRTTSFREIAVMRPMVPCE